MKTTIYLIRHSEPFKEHKGIMKTNESLLLENEKTPLSINGEKMAEQWSMNNELKQLDSIWSSNYVRSMSTAKYFAYMNGLKVNVDERFNERNHGVSTWSELPDNFEQQQSLDLDYKIKSGESNREVANRMYNAINELLNNYSGKKICIISHATAITFYLMKWCEYKYCEYLKHNNKIIFDGNWRYLETFKLEFENNELVSIENIR